MFVKNLKIGDKKIIWCEGEINSLEVFIFVRVRFFFRRNRVFIRSLFYKDVFILLVMDYIEFLIKNLLK